MLETRMEKFLYMGVVPMVAATLGGTAGALLQAQTCSVIGATEISALLENAQMNGAQKLQFMKHYLDLTDRPWSLARTMMSFVSTAAFAALGIFAASGGFRRH